MSRPRIGILLSGRGSNFEAIARNVLNRSIDADIGVVFSNRPGAPGLERASQLGLPTDTIASAGVDRVEFDRQVAGLLDRYAIDLVCLAGYMRILTGEFVRKFPQRLLNIHPSLLPAFPGLDAQYQALQHGVKVTGCTVHFVDENVDGGPILLQATVLVLDDDSVDSLSSRILEQEHRIYSEAIRWVLNGNFRIEGRRVLKT